MYKFDEDFVFGSATSAYQIEGAISEDGKTDSIWDEFCKTKGNIQNGDTGEIACDHYHRYEEDIKLMKEIGLESYRLSISWPRIFPEEGKYNPQGMEFYKKVIRKLKENGIEPAVTLYHWDLPMWAFKKGGWKNREVIADFVEYSKKVFEELNGMVENWITHNEPYVVSIIGHYYGEHAPGHTNLQEALEVAHNLLLSHGKVTKAFRDMDIKGKIGITLNLGMAYPESDSKKDKLAAKRLDGMLNRWFLDPLFKGEYPKDMLELYTDKLGIDTSFIKNKDFDYITEDIDFFGINYYSRSTVKYSENSDLNFENGEKGYKKTEMGWEVDPNALYELIIRLRDEYTKLPIMITENGAAYEDEVTKNQEVIDEERTEYIREHLKVVSKLNKEGYNISAYYLWSLFDNFEWAFGYSKRFGIIYVDFKTQKRILKKSAKTYSEIIKSREVKE
ncbi:MAG: GH1 family beta-glucosidase [Fusobacteriota bacterium]